MAFTKIVGAGIHTLSNITSHNIHSSGIITATKFDGPFDGSTGDFSGNVTIGGNLTVNGTTTTLDTNLIDVDKIEVTTAGTNVAVAVTHNGSGDLVRLYDGASQVVTVDDEGNVGIGSAMPSAKLDIVNGTTSISVTKTNNNPHIDFKANNVIQACQIKAAESAGGGVLQFFTKTTGGTATQRASIDTDGNVGINSTIPAAKLDVAGTSIITGGISVNVSPAITIRNGTTVKGYIGFNVNDPFIGRKSGVGLLFQDNKVRPVIGDSGIGTNNTVSLGEPTYKFKDLYLEGDIHIDSDVGQLRIGADEDLKIDHNGSNAYFMNGTGSTINRAATYIFENGNGSIEYARITDDGYLGINQTSPIHPISIGINTATAWAANKNISNTTNNDFIGLNIDNQDSGANPEVGIMFQAGASSSGQYTINCRKTAGNQGELIFRTRDGGSASKEVLKIDSGGRTKFMGTRAGVLQPEDTDSVNLYTKSTNNSINRGAGISFFIHDNSDFEMGGTIQVAKENATADDTASYMRFCTRPAGSNTNPTLERLRITSAGKIGFNEDNPSKQFSYAYTESANYSSTNAVYDFLLWNKANISSYPTCGSSIQLRAGNTSAGGGNITGVRRGPANQGDLAFSTTDASGNPVEKLRITSDGLVGIGTLIPQTKFEVSSATGTRIRARHTNAGGGRDAGFDIWSDDSGTFATRASLVHSGSAGRTTLYAQNRFNIHSDQTDTSLYIARDGKVGIGTDDPLNPLEVWGSSVDLAIMDTQAYSQNSSGPAVGFQGYDSAGVRKTFADIRGVANGSNIGEFAIRTRRTGGTLTEALRIDSSGYVTKPATPAFFATHTGATSPVTGTLTYNTSGTGYYNNGTHLNVTDGKFTAPVAGIYHFHFHGFIQSNASSSYFETNFVRYNAAANNNTTMTRQYGSNSWTGSDYGPSFSLQLTCEMAINDKMYVVHNGCGFHGSNGYYFGGHLIG